MGRRRPGPPKKENVSLKRQRPVPEMCEGCARDLETICETINEPAYFWEKYENCFAWVDKAKAKKIELEIAQAAGLKKPRKAAQSV